MPSLIAELQECALDRTVSTADLLRRALVAAKKLGLMEFEQWIVREMDGYPVGGDIPEYRYVTGSVRAFNPLRGWIPVQFDDDEQAKWLSRMPIIQPVAELEALTIGAKASGSVMMSYGTKVEQQLLRGSMMTGFALQVPITRMTGIIDATRNAILKWALQLDGDGIMGDGHTFTPRERETAQQHNYSVNNFFGSVGMAQVQQNSPHAIQIGGDAAIDAMVLRPILDLLRGVKAELGDTEEGRELQADIDTAEAQSRSPKPRWRVVREAMASARRIVESAAGRIAGGTLAERLKEVDWSSVV